MATASFGLQAGPQSFGYALFFMTESALEYLKKSSGWKVGVGPNIVVVDEGMALSGRQMLKKVLGFLS
jgi:lipid-binding SYLF domain-containing protein